MNNPLLYVWNQWRAGWGAWNTSFRGAREQGTKNWMCNRRGPIEKLKTSGDRVALLVHCIGMSGKRGYRIYLNKTKGGRVHVPFSIRTSSPKRWNQLKLPVTPTIPGYWLMLLVITQWQSFPESRGSALLVQWIFQIWGQLIPSDVDIAVRRYFLYCGGGGTRRSRDLVQIQ